MKQSSISHFVGLSGVGGVQRSFIEYLKYLETNPGNFKHKVYTLGVVDFEYKSEISIDVLNINKISNLFRLIQDLLSNNIIVHFYNNLSSLKVALFLVFLPVRKLIIHERGTAWNQTIKTGFITRFNAQKADLILVNSRATKTLLIKKFLISEDIISVIHNGVSTPNQSALNNVVTEHNKFKVGFIGRLDSPKGVHVLISAIQYLSEHNIQLFIAGDGPLFKELEEQAKNNTNIIFLGRVQSPFNFLKTIDLLVVPSIREPLGNVCLEAGLCSVPVLASNIDGIPEIIKHGISGELLNPTDNLTFKSAPGIAPVPEYVVDPETQSLRPPMQLNIDQLAGKILELRKDPNKLNRYGLELRRTVINQFTLEKYSENLESIYNDINRTKS